MTTQFPVRTLVERTNNCERKSDFSGSTRLRRGAGHAGDGIRYGDELFELGGDGGHWIFFRTQAASRSEHWTDIAQGVIRRAVHDGNKAFARQECRKLFVRDALSREAFQQRGRHEHDPDARVRESLVNGTHQRHAETNVLLAEPYPDADCF